MYHRVGEVVSRVLLRCLWSIARVLSTRVYARRYKISYFIIWRRVWCWGAVLVFFFLGFYFFYLSSLPSLFRFRFGRRFVLFHPVFFLRVLCCLLGFCCDSFSVSYASDTYVCWSVRWWHFFCSCLRYTICFSYFVYRVLECLRKKGGDSLLKPENRELPSTTFFEVFAWSLTPIMQATHPNIWRGKGCGGSN